MKIGKTEQTELEIDFGLRSILRRAVRGEKLWILCRLWHRNDSSVVHFGTLLGRQGVPKIMIFSGKSGKIIKKSIQEGVQKKFRKMMEK